MCIYIHIRIYIYVAWNFDDYVCISCMFWYAAYMLNTSDVSVSMSASLSLYMSLCVCLLLQVFAFKVVDFTVSLFVCLSVCLSVYVTVFACASVCIYLCLNCHFLTAVTLFVSVWSVTNVRPSACVSACLSVYLHEGCSYLLPSAV